MNPNLAGYLLGRQMAWLIMERACSGLGRQHLWAEGERGRNGSTAHIVLSDVLREHGNGCGHKAWKLKVSRWQTAPFDCRWQCNQVFREMACLHLFHQQEQLLWNTGLSHLFYPQYKTWLELTGVWHFWPLAGQYNIKWGWKKVEVEVEDCDPL